MAGSVCDTGKTRLSFADVRRTCRVGPAGLGLGNVESTPIGFVHNGTQISGFLPVQVGRDKCATVWRKPACAPC